MKNPQVQALRYLLADWFIHFASKAGLNLPQRGQGQNQLTLGSPATQEVVARFTEGPPFLEFVPKTGTDAKAVAEAASLATAKIAANDFGGVVWYNFELCETDFNFFSPHGGIGSLVLRLGTQQRILGWRRLGAPILLEFVEGPSKEANPDRPLLAAPAIVHVHVAVPGPAAGFFSDFVAHGIIEPISAICGFALGRPVDPPPALFPSRDGKSDEAARRQRDPSVLTLARKTVSLDIFSPTSVDGGLDWSSRARSALITFDAAMRQERDSVASILYVVAAESLTVPSAKWREHRLTARFVDFYLRELAPALDTIVAHGNFEEAFDIRRHGKRPESLRKRLLLKIYGVRSRQVHEGLLPTYRGMFGVHNTAADMQRALIHDFAEAAILSYLGAPRSSLLGHPALDPAVRAEV